MLVNCVLEYIFEYVTSARDEFEMRVIPRFVLIIRSKRMEFDRECA
jgi:hypothetical protein